MLLTNDADKLKTKLSLWLNRDFLQAKLVKQSVKILRWLVVMRQHIVQFVGWVSCAE
jgi:hypothetical protein